MVSHTVRDRHRLAMYKALKYRKIPKKRCVAVAVRLRLFFSIYLKLVHVPAEDRDSEVPQSRTDPTSGLRPSN